MGILATWFGRNPDFTVKREDGDYLRRWYVIPRNRWFNIYLHNMVQDDDPRALHDHPWWNVSIVLKGGYYEVVPAKPLSPSGAWLYAHPSLRNYSESMRAELAKPYLSDNCVVRWRGPGSIIFRRATDAHRLMLDNERNLGGEIVHYTPSWSLFITGPKRRKWGFWCPQGWKPFDEYVRKVDGEGRGNAIGAGCDG